ncbi:MAG TPA: hypothetical protein VH170_07765 [Chthoniobacterales bacterium]|nr:hypothetical protein [Chthoniobacterales bacterium]
MKRCLILISLLALTLSTHLFAALGNTENQIEELFGKPEHVGLPDAKGVSSNLYRKGDYVILVQFLKHLSLAESYARSDQKELSEREIDLFLEGSSNGNSWTKEPNKQAWERSDYKARAWCQPVSGRPTLLVQAH